MMACVNCLMSAAAWANSSVYIYDLRMCVHVVDELTSFIAREIEDLQRVRACVQLTALVYAGFAIFHVFQESRYFGLPLKVFTAVGTL